MRAEAGMGVATVFGMGGILGIKCKLWVRGMTIIETL